MRGQLLQLIRLEYKRTFVDLRRVAGSLALMTGMVALCSLLGARVQSRYGAYEPVPVGVVAVGDEREVSLALRLISAMESVQRVCTLQPVTADEASRGVQSGELSGAIFLTEHFYEDVNTGVNTPIRVLLPESGDDGAALFYELLRDAVSDIGTVEAGIYAAADAGWTAEASLSRYETETLLTERYFEAVLRRDSFYESLVASPFGETSLAAYYASAAVVLCLLLMGFYFGFLYAGREQNVDRKLRAYGIGAGRTSAVRVLVMTTVLFLLAWVLRIALGILLGVLGYDASAPSMAGLLLLLPVCLSIACFFHLAYSFSGEVWQGRLLLILLFLGFVLLGGLILPAVYLPAGFREICRFLPVAAWHSLIAADFENAGIPAAEMAYTLCAAALLGGAGTLLQGKRW